MTEQEKQESYKALGDVQRHTYDREVGTRIPWPMPRSSESHDIADELDILAIINEAGDRNLARSLRRACERIRELEAENRRLIESARRTEGQCE